MLFLHRRFFRRAVWQALALAVPAVFPMTRDLLDMSEESILIREEAIAQAGLQNVGRAIETARVPTTVGQQLLALTHPDTWAHEPYVGHVMVYSAVKLPTGGGVALTGDGGFTVPLEERQPSHAIVVTVDSVLLVSLGHRPSACPVAGTILPHKPRFHVVAHIPLSALLKADVLPLYPSYLRLRHAGIREQGEGIVADDDTEPDAGNSTITSSNLPTLPVSARSIDVLTVPLQTLVLEMASPATAAAAAAILHRPVAQPKSTGSVRVSLLNRRRGSSHSLATARSQGQASPSPA
jgi:hypothetical protein